MTGYARVPFALLVEHPFGQHLGDVHRLPPGTLLDHFAAAEAVGKDQRVGRGLADGREQHALTDRLGDVIGLGGKTE